MRAYLLYDNYKRLFCNLLCNYVKLNCETEEERGANVFVSGMNLNFSMVHPYSIGSFIPPYHYCTADIHSNVIRFPIFSIYFVSANKNNVQLSSLWSKPEAVRQHLMSYIQKTKMLDFSPSQKKGEKQDLAFSIYCF